MPGALIYLSNCGIQADGRANPFMMQELPWLMRHFDQVMLVSYYGVRTFQPGDETGRNTLTTVRPGMAGLRAWLRAPFTRDLWRELSRMAKEHALTPLAALKLAAFTQRGLKMHYWTEWLLKHHPAPRTTLYSCWMSFDGYAAALSKRRHPRVRCVVRGHAYDIDTERNPMNPYLMKQRIAQEADGLYFISKTARQQYLSYMAGRVDKRKLHVLAMGSGGEPVETPREAPMYTQGVMRVVSCAMLIPIKQVHLLAEALANWQGGPVCWTHIGGGEGEAELRKLISEKLDPKENVICELLGTLDSARIQQIYDTKAFDVFVNTSRKEGVPISIMEAMRHGIPVIAPRVGGIPELVTPDVGYLYDPAEGAQGVLNALEQLASLPRERAERMRSAAKRRWDKYYCSAALLPRLFPEQAGRAGARAK